MDKVLERITELIQTYESGEWLSPDKLRIILRELSANYYYLTKVNIESYNNWNNVVYNRGKDSVSGAKVKADKEVPELRITRKILEATDHVIWSVRSELSILKKEN
jgi:hypothetical protein